VSIHALTVFRLLLPDSKLLLKRGKESDSAPLCYLPPAIVEASTSCKPSLACLVQSTPSQNGASQAQIEGNGKAAHGAVVQAVTSNSNGSNGRSNGVAVLQNGAAAAHQKGNGIGTVAELKDAATIVSVTENGTGGADIDLEGSWDPCDVGHLDSCAHDRY